ncbi:branched-chain amino acid ABC transporter permease [Bauldia litoralis]|uniref:Branched-chain amino acid transport system permease protein n=1 Tax=Bauldia litoralis TaxID=665467 RepID=A0A1G6BA86_9HYPH|nr:branched-chain amino acid ABC transporter permease [Bauldia litoralis]SDB17537.1 branched-chain amino acid transport system permease protein [Bauldia litoralis]
MIDFAIYALTLVAIWSVMAISLNIQFGMTGLVNFGQILPFAIGAYAAAIGVQYDLPWWVGAVAGLVAAPIAGILVILPAGRSSQDYWALITLGAGEIFRLTMLNVPSIAGGADGVTVSRLPDRTLAAGLAVALCVVAYAVAQQIGNGPFGRMLRVIREDETLAATLGRSPMSFRMRVTVVSWAMAGVAGVLYAHVIGYVAPTSFLVTDTFLVWTAVILGGPGRNIGVVIGAAILILMSVSTRFLAEWSGLPSDLVANLRLAVFGLILVLMFLFRPAGLFPETKRVQNVDGL